MIFILHYLLKVRVLRFLIFIKLILCDRDSFIIDKISALVQLTVLIKEVNIVGILA